MRRRSAQSAPRSAAPRIRTTTASTPAARAAAIAAAAAGGFRLLDQDRPAVEVRAVQAADGLLGVLGRRHLDEPEATRPAGLPIRHDARGFDGAGAGEGLTQALSGGRERKTADEEFDCHAKGSILGRTVHSEPTTTSDAPKYTLSEAHTRRIFPRREVLGGREPP